MTLTRPIPLERADDARRREGQEILCRHARLDAMRACRCPRAPTGSRAPAASRSAGIVDAGRVTARPKAGCATSPSTMSTRARKRRCKAGAKIMQPAFDIPGVGRIVILAEPGGAGHRLDDAGGGITTEPGLERSSGLLLCSKNGFPDGAWRFIRATSGGQHGSPQDRLARGMARRPQGASGRRKGVHARARCAKPQAPRTALGAASTRTTCSRDRTARRRLPICSAARAS